MNLRKRILGVLLCAIVLGTTSCSKKEDSKPADDTSETEVVNVKDLPADPSTRDEDGNKLPTSNKYTFYSFSDSTIVPNSDSATNQWDVGFRGSSIIMNSQLNGPGDVEGKVVKRLFEKVTAIPEKGFSPDTETGNLFSDWYNYDLTNHVISPVPGYIMVIHTNDDRYVKMEVLSYYKGAPSNPDSDDVSGYYTFHYQFLD